MRTYVDGFDTKVGTKATEVTATLDQRLSRFQEALDSRTQTLNDALSSRVMDIAKTLAEGGKEVVTALDKRISDVTGLIDTRGAELATTLGAKIDDIDRMLGARAMEVANNLDTRIDRFEQLLVGRAEAVTEQLETRTRAAAEAILTVANARMAGAIRVVSIERGHDPREFAYMPFGGGGGLHVCAMMREVGVRTGIVPRYPGVTSALGCVMADMRHDAVQTLNLALPEVD